MAPRSTAEAEAALSAELVRLAEASPGAEACGLVVALGERLEAWPMENAAVDPRARFEVAPEAMLTAMLRLEAAGGRLLAVYHSHPAGGPHLSAADASGLPDEGVAAVVVALSEGRGRVVRWHRRGADGWVHRDPWRAPER